MSKIPRKISLNRYDFLVQSTDNYQQQQAQWPFFAYNLGMKKIAFIHLMRKENCREYILQLQPEHNFITFVEFNDYKDIGFFGEELLIEGCVSFSFLSGHD